MNPTVQITAPCRLHFGLLRFAQTAGLSYGGLGMMLDQPATVIEMQQADAWQATGPDAERALAFAQQACRYWSDSCEVPFSIHVKNTPPAHAGLGSGTQLALAAAKGVNLLSNVNIPDMADLSAAVSRGQRSAIGSHGFLHGGLLWEIGRDPEESLAQLTCRIDVPKSWRVLLITPPQAAGLHGSAEIDAFAKLPPVPPEVTKKLQHLAEAAILPAIEQANFTDFSEFIYKYGHLAGSCFTPIQGGPYASPAVAQRIEKLRELGIQGVGQSSWGPTIFSFLPDEAKGKSWLEWLPTLPEFANCQLTLTSPNNTGATVEYK